MKTLQQSATEYAARGWHVMPLHYPTPQNDSPCSCGKPTCSVGKHPVDKRGLKSSTNDIPSIERYWARNTNANIGIATGAVSNLLVVDVDVRDGKGGDATIAAWEAEHGKMPNTVMVRTGSGGSQYYYKYPSDGYTYANKQSMKGGWHYAGIDIRGEGGYVVAPPSLHVSGNRYEWINSPSDTEIADAPSWLLEELRNCSGKKSKQTTTNDISFDDAATMDDKTFDAVVSMPKVESPYHQHLRERAIAYLATCDAAIQGSGGDSHTFNVAGQLLSLQCGRERLSESDVVDLMGKHWNDKCSPPWSLYGPNSLAAKVHSASRNGSARTTKLCKTCNADSETDKPTDTPYEMSDVGNGRLFADTYADNLLYVAKWNRWASWDGKRWALDDETQVRRKAHDLVRTVLPQRAAAIADDDRRRGYLKHAAASQSTAKVTAMLREAEPYLAVEPSVFDADPMLLNCLNGTVDCKTGELRPHRRSDRCSKLLPFNYNPQASAPTWSKFLNRIFDGNAQLIAFVQTAVGYSLTGSVDEQCMLILWGSGANGKSTLIETLLYMLGDYGASAQSDLLMTTRWGSANDEGTAALMGCRMVAARETGEGKTLAESKMKSLTGGDTITACRKYEHQFSFEPTHKLWLATNHKPRIRGSDEGIWRRIRLIPFAVEIPQAERDTRLLAKLKAEGEGILAWAIEGMLRWQREGLATPTDVTTAVSEYRNESDIFGQFIADCCETCEDADGVGAKELYTAYREWAKDAGMDHALTIVSFGGKLVDRGYTKAKRPAGLFWRGLRLADGSGECDDSAADANDFKW